MNSRRENSSCIVFLTGGLGNQLFQLARGFHCANGGTVFLEWRCGKPRLNKDGFPEIMSLALPSNVRLLDKPYNGIASKIFGRLVRTSTNNADKLDLSRFIFSAVGNVVVKIFFGKKYRLLLAQGIGFSENANASGNFFVIGYFQTYHWISDPKCKFLRDTLESGIKFNEMNTFKNLAELEKPLIVHIRLGDYRNEEVIGILDPNYYKSAIKLMWETGRFKKIWVFSDEIEFVRRNYFNESDSNMRYFSDILDSTSTTFEVMRNGSGYVIANSTFSWWAAYLAKNKESQICAPSRWFKNGSSPLEITPKDWTLLNGWGESNT